jgi:hypothetical protein
LLLLLCQVPQAALAADGDKGGEPKLLSGISLVGNDEAPKSLFIVPWKSSEIGFETGLTSGLMDDTMRPVDRDVFMREIDFYELSHAQ